MRALRVLLVALLASPTLAGCLGAGQKPWFPPPSALPDGLVPFDPHAAPGNFTLRVMGMATNPGATGAVSVATALGLTHAEAYLLHAAASPYETYAVLALDFRDPALVQDDLAAPGGCDQGSPVLRDGLSDARHVYRSGETFVFVLGGGRLALPNVVDDLARVVQERSGATRLC